MMKTRSLVRTRAVTWTKVITVLSLYLLTSTSVAENVTSPSHHRVTHYGEAVLLDCAALHTLSPDGVFKYWILPSLEIIGENFTRRYPASSSIVVLGNNFSLAIPAIERKQLGDYLCHVETPVGQSLVRVPSYSRVTVYLYLPPIWDRYYMNFITALSAAAACLLLATLLCAINSLRWREVRDKIFEGAIVVEISGGGHVTDSSAGAVVIGVRDHQLERKVNFGSSDVLGVSNAVNGYGEKNNKNKNKLSRNETETPM